MPRRNWKLKVHLNRETIDQEKAAKEFWEKALKPKWEAKAEKLYARLKADPSLLGPNRMQPKQK